MNRTKEQQGRQAVWNTLKDNKSTWDIIVVGGGITGAGIFRQAARQGYKVLLVEQQDYAWGTSSRSSKMVHGGFRYIAQGDIQLTKEALHEREQMLKDVPGLVDRAEFVFPLRRGRFPGRFALTVLLKVYDLLAGVNDCDYIKNDKLAKKVPGIDEANTKGAVSYSDAITDDTRLVMRVIQEGKQKGGIAINYVKAEELLRDEKGKVTSVRIKREDTQESLELNAKVVINATGAWADNLMHSPEGEKKIRPLRGSHLILKADKFPLKNALTLIHPDDGRPIFMFPWYGRILLGTTDLDYPEDLDLEASITNVECDYLFKVVNEFFPKSDCNRNDVIASFCGVRPVISSGRGVDPSKEKRGHSVWQQENLISVSGGKLTIWRVIADEVLEIASVFLSKHYKAEKNILDVVDFNDQEFRLNELNLSDHYVHLLKGRYGNRLGDFIEYFPDVSYQEIESFGFSIADCLWAINEEQVLHIDDLLFRRTRLGLLQDDEFLLNDLAEVMAEALNWSVDEKESEIKRYRKIRNDYYQLPQT